MAFLPKLFQIVDAMFAGTSLDQMRNDTITLLNQIIEEAEDDEIPDMIRELCESISAAVSTQGKQVDADACYDLLYNTVMEERAKIKARMMMTKMFRKRRRRSSSGYGI